MDFWDLPVYVRQDEELRNEKGLKCAVKLQKWLGIFPSFDIDWMSRCDNIAEDLKPKLIRKDRESTHGKLLYNCGRVNCVIDRL